MSRLLSSLLVSLIGFLTFTHGGRATEHTEHDGSAPHEDHRHHVGLFFGGATRYESGRSSETGLAIGLDYEYRFAPKWGVGGLIEGVTFNENHRDLAFAVPVTFHPIAPLKLSAGPGFELNGHRAEFLVRFSVAYSIQIKKFTLTPEVALDVLEHTRSLIYGFSIGRGF